MADAAMLKIRVNEQMNSEPLETAVAATEEESVILAEKLTQVAIPLEVLMQALNIAKYDKAAAFRYADNYVSGIINQTRKPKWIVIKAGSFSEMKWSYTRTARIAYCNLRN
ncbi:hypothetical protein NIES21_60270 (plasmid) [Anabaenopsis circularis NIES-21]|uniref:Uncharacterized protein n=1 Tax=Anabaenopsis circularis NIES-21 TaxID=1085406 RepID=A0A1Z4GRP0_9CYAN|nr:hypothetical protein NIES21_60270 [Anabaenopsis circularis NIES-21]